MSSIGMLGINDRPAVKISSIQIADISNLDGELNILKDMIGEIKNHIQEADDEADGMRKDISYIERRIAAIETRLKILENPKSVWVANSKGGVL